MKYINRISKINRWDAENVFYLKSDHKRISKFITHYEIFQKIKKVPGDIVECGVFRGASLCRFLNFTKIFSIKKKVFGFDTFGKFPSNSRREDKKFSIKHNKNIGFGISDKDLNKILKKNKFRNFKLIKGDIINTLPLFLEKNKIRISLLHLDLDVFTATKFALEKLYPLMSKNGIILRDDYNQISNTTRAVNKFIKKKKNLKISKLDFPNRPSFIIKK